jgi:hypothetical protein
MSGLPYELENHEPANSYMLMLHQGQFVDPEENQRSLLRAFQLYYGKRDPLKNDMMEHLMSAEGAPEWIATLAKVRRVMTFGKDGKIHLSDLSAKSAFDALLGRRTEKQKAALRIVSDGLQTPASDAILEDAVEVYEVQQASQLASAGEDLDFTLDLRAAVEARLRNSTLGRARRCALEHFEDLPPLGHKSFEEVATETGLTPQSLHEAHQDELARLAERMGLAG